MNLRKKSLAVAALALTVIAAACGDDDAATTTTAGAPTTTLPAPTTTAAPMDLVATAQAAGGFTTLLAAVEAAGLTETLQGEGPFTVFAPTDAAFAALPAGTVESLLADIPALTDILLYHVVSGAVLSGDVVMLDAATTVQSSDIAIEVVDGEVILNGAVKVTAVDIAASNGVIHVIDAVLLPPAEALDVIATAEAAGGFTTLLAAVDAAGLTETLQGEGPFTVFAPTDDAFALLPAGTVESLLADIPALTNILLYHVVSGAVLSGDVVTLDAATTLQGGDVVIEVIDGKVILNGIAEVITVDIETSNGVIHVIDAVLLPAAA